MKDLKLHSDVDYTNHQQPVSSELIERHNQRLSDQAQHPMITIEKIEVLKAKVYSDQSIEYKLEPIEPKIFIEALINKDWRDVMKEEFNALVKNKTWKLVPSSPCYNIVGNKWAFRMKHNSNGSI